MMKGRSEHVLIECVSCGTMRLGRRYEDGTLSQLHRNGCNCGGQDFILVDDRD